MSQVKPMGLVESLRGKICRHSDVYFFQKNGKVFTGKICHPCSKAPTANQTAQRAKFATARANATKAMADPEQRKRYEQSFCKQRKYVDFSGYVCAMEYAKLN